MHQYSYIASKHGIKSDPIKLHQNFKQSWKRLSKDHPNFGLRTIGWRLWWQSIVIDTFHNSDADEKQLKALSRDLVAHFETADAWTVAEGGHNLLTSLKNQNLKLGVISNFDPRLHIIMKNLNLTDYFAFVLTSYEAGFSKPDPKIFEEALRRGRVQNKSSMVHVGNDKYFDYDGAKLAGLRAILLQQNSSAIFPDKINRLDQVLDCVNNFK